MREKYYINSFPYEVELTARICHENAKMLLESITTALNIDEFTVLDTIIAKPNLSQADLARLLLKGKAHTGRFIMSLENKGFVERKIEERDGKLIKVTIVTEKGMETYKQILRNLKPSIKKFQEELSQNDIDNMIKNLQKIRKSIEKVNKIVFD